MQRTTQSGEKGHAIVFESFVGAFGITKSGAIGASAGAAIAFLRRRDWHSLTLALAGFLFALSGIRAAMWILELPRELELATGLVLALIGGLAGFRLMHLIETLEWSTIRELLPFWGKGR